MKKLILLLALLASARAYGTPAISSVSGPCNYGGTLTINGAGFGTKPVQQQTYFLANFDDASAGVAGTTWCVTTSMNNLSNVTRGTSNCFEGAGCLTNAATMQGHNDNTAGVSHTDVGAGGKLFCSFVWRLDGTPVNVTENFKSFRWWSNFAKNNWYMAQQIDAGFVGFLVETALDTFDAATMRQYTNRMVPPPNVHQQMQIMMKENSAGNATDGQLFIDQGQVRQIDTTSFQSNTANDTAQNGRYNLAFPVHMVWTAGATGGAGFHSDNAMYYDDIIIDTSWCQVWVTTSSTLATSGPRYWLAVQTWSAGTITAVVPQVFANATSLYVYVRENGGTINSTGFPVTFGGENAGGGGDPPAVLNPDADLRGSFICPCTTP